MSRRSYDYSAVLIHTDAAAVSQAAGVRLLCEEYEWSASPLAKSKV
ncbi:MAG TPA: hypothetical protein VK025_13630 [Steroidobacter sp.]|jgi:hypothetical protein|nr:hypothetical protein [Steroidobacteraceae bacterium]HLS82437.1 hypothetical protein [Steroidobacter sp.]